MGSWRKKECDSARLIANDVCSSGKHYPLEFRPFIKEEDCKDKDIPFKDPTQLFMELIDWTVAKKIRGDFVFDSDDTNAKPLNHINSLCRRYEIESFGRFSRETDACKRYCSIDSTRYSKGVERKEAMGFYKELLDSESR